MKRQGQYALLLSVDSLLEGVEADGERGKTMSSDHSGSVEAHSVASSVSWRSKKLPISLEALSLSPKKQQKMAASSKSTAAFLNTKEADRKSLAQKSAMVNSGHRSSEDHTTSTSQSEESAILQFNDGVDNGAFITSPTLNSVQTQTYGAARVTPSLHADEFVAMEDVQAVLRLWDSIKCHILQANHSQLQVLRHLFGTSSSTKKHHSSKINLEISRRLGLKTSSNRQLSEVSRLVEGDGKGCRCKPQPPVGGALNRMRGDSGQPLQRALLPGMTSTDKLGESLPGAEVDGGDDSLEEVAKGEDNSNTCSQEPPARIDEQNNKERGQLQTIAAKVLGPDIDDSSIINAASNQSEAVPMDDLTVANQSEHCSPHQTNQSKHSMEVENFNGYQLKTLTLYKDSEPLGATVRKEGNAVVIARIIKGGVAEKTKFLKPGDEILQINNVDVRGSTIDEVATLMSTLSGELKLVTKVNCTVRLGAVNRSVPRRDITVRAQFDYDVTEDDFLPCVELGVGFKVGSILHVINRDDPHWWQAYREGDNPEALAGLIPSRVFSETREQLRRTILSETNESLKEKPTLTCCGAVNRRLLSKRRTSIQYEQYQGDVDQILTYEEVGMYLPPPNRKRPIVLVGCEELRLHKICERLVSTDRRRFSQPIMTTSRPSDTHQSGMQFLSLDKFIEKIKSGEFIEYKVVDSPEMHYVGVSRSSVMDLINSGATCVTQCQPKNITNIRNSDMKPYVIFVAAPPVKRLKDFIRTESTIEPQNEECQHIIDLSRHNESTYTYLYDHILTLVDMGQACTEIIAQVNQLDAEPHWVPINWVPQVDGKTNSNYGTMSCAAPAQRKSKILSTFDSSLVEEIDLERTQPLAEPTEDGRWTEDL